MFNVNVLGLLLATQAAVKHMSSGGSIINIGSVVSRTAPANSAVYTATKASVDAITGVLSKELGPKRIRVYSVNPGIVETEGSHSAGVIGSDFAKGLVAQPHLDEPVSWTTSPLWLYSSLRRIQLGSRANPSLLAAVCTNGSVVGAAIAPQLVWTTANTIRGASCQSRRRSYGPFLSLFGEK